LIQTPPGASQHSTVIPDTHIMSWRDDGAGKLEIDGARVNFCGADGSKANALWSAGGTGYWEFKVSGPPGTWVGVSSEDKFGAGYGTKGLFYGGPGNLSDGGSLVTGQWGPEFGNNDVIGMRLEQAGDKVSLAYSKNGSPLGVAFDIQGWTGSEFCPAVSMSDAGQSVSITAGSLPDLASMGKSAGPREGVEGAWQGRFKLNIKNTGSGAWRFNAKAGNSMSCSVTEKDGCLTVGPIMSTKMMPPPHLQELEQEVTALLQGLTSFKREGGNLVVEGNGLREVCQPDQGPGPAAKDQVNWMK